MAINRRRLDDKGHYAGMLPEPRKAIWGMAGLGVFCLAGVVSNLINLFWVNHGAGYPTFRYTNLFQNLVRLAQDQHPEFLVG